MGIFSVTEVGAELSFGWSLIIGGIFMCNNRWFFGGWPHHGNELPHLRGHGWQFYPYINGKFFQDDRKTVEVQA